MSAEEPTTPAKQPPAIIVDNQGNDTNSISRFDTNEDKQEQIDIHIQIEHTKTDTQSYLNDYNYAGLGQRPAAA